MQALEKLRPLTLLLLRLGLGVIFVYYGFPKLFVNTHATVQVFAKLGFPSYFAYLSGVIELFGGILLIAGIFTRIAALVLGGEMVVVVWKVQHMFSNPRAVPTYQFAMMCGLGALVLVTFGADLISLDQAIFGGGKKASSRKAR